MRALSALLLVLASCATAAALGTGDPVPPGAYCPSYDVDSGEVGPARAQASSLDQRPWGALVLTWLPYYIVEDTFYANAVFEPYTFSLWIYEETNGVPGLQRGDSACSQVAPGEEADTIVNS